MLVIPDIAVYLDRYQTTLVLLALQMRCMLVVTLLVPSNVNRNTWVSAAIFLGSCLTLVSEDRRKRAWWVNKNHRSDVV